MIFFRRAKLMSLPGEVPCNKIMETHLRTLVNAIAKVIESSIMSWLSSDIYLE